MLICSCPKFESTRTKLKRQSFMQKKLHVNIWTFGNKLEDVSVDVPTWERWEHGVKMCLIFKLFTESLQTCFSLLCSVNYLGK